MPHASFALGDVEVLALCDGVVEASRTLDEAFPTVPADAWPHLRARYPEAIGPNGRWQLHVHCFVLRAGGRTILFDTGIGPATAPAFGWSGTAGRLPGELAEVGVAPDDVDLVVISHVHDDHLGWTVADDGSPSFPDARYVVHRADLEALRGSDDPEDREIWRRTLAPLDDAGVLDPNDTPTEIADGLGLIHAPGHTPGHQVLLIDGDPPGVLSADVTNHPALVEEPSWHQQTDADPERAAATRAVLLERFERERRLYVTSHFAEPLGTIVSDRDGRRFRPL